MSSSRAKISMLTAGGVIALGIFFGVRWAQKHRWKDPAPQRRDPLPLPANRLPKGMTRLSRFTDQAPEPAAGEDEEKLSALAGSPCCGGYDVFAAALAATDPSEPPDQLVRILSLPPNELKAGLLCARALESARDRDSSSYRIAFEIRSADAGKHSHYASIETLHLERLPATSSFIKPIELPGLEHARCSVGPYADPQATCLPKAATCARVAGTKCWVDGDLEDLRALGAELGSGNGRGEELADFEWFAKELSGYLTTQIHREASAFRDALVYGLWTEPFPYMSLTKQKDALDKALEAGFSVGAIAEGREPKDFELHAQIVAKTEADAEKIELALREYVQALASRLRGNLPRTLEHGNTPQEQLDRAWQNTRAARRAWQNASVSRDRGRVWFKTNRRPTEDEESSKKRYDHWIESKRLAAARLVGALLEGRPAPSAELELLGGPTLVALVEKGHRPYFEGDWRCSTAGSPDRYFSFIDGKAYAGRARETARGRYSYQLEREWSGTYPARVRIGTGGDAETLAIEHRRSGISLRVGESPELDCRRARDSDREREAPTTIRFDLPEPSSENYYTPADLERFGLKVERIDANRSVICGFDPANCLCFEPLPCEARGDCPTFDENIEIFEKAAGNVSCERAETGRAGGFRYFDFEGDIHRYEVRWFDGSGRLVAQRNLTDYSEYCGGKTSGRWMGRIPAADSTIRERLVCGKAKKSLLPPLEDLRNLLGTGLEIVR